MRTTHDQDADVGGIEPLADRLLLHVNREANAGLDLDVLTLGFARRVAAYKRPELLFQNLDRLRAIAAKAGGLQVIFAGKAHSHDQQGKELIKRIFQAKEALKSEVRVVYLGDVIRHAIALNGSFFNTQRMVLRYVVKACFGIESLSGAAQSG